MGNNLFVGLFVGRTCVIPKRLNYCDFFLQ